MSSLTDNLTRLSDARDDIVDAITNRGGVVVTNAGFEDFPSSISAIPNIFTQSDEGKVVSNGTLVSQTSSTAVTNGVVDTTLINSLTVAVKNPDVNIYDYDGTIISSYTKEEFLALTSYPAHPDRSSEGLTSDGWTWEFNDAQTYVQNHGMLEIGAMYYPTSGNTEVHITVPANTSFSIYGTAYNNGDYGSIVWGDGSTTKTNTSSFKTYSHTYTNAGNYVITFTVPNANVQWGLGHSSSAYNLFYTGTIYDTSSSQYVTSLYINNHDTSVQNINLNSLDIPIVISRATTSGGVIIRDAECGTRHLNVCGTYINFSTSSATNVSLTNMILKTISLNFSNTSTSTYLNKILRNIRRVTINQGYVYSTTSSTNTFDINNVFMAEEFVSDYNSSYSCNATYRTDFINIKILDLSALTTGELPVQVFRYCFNIEKIIFPNTTSVTFASAFSTASNRNYIPQSIKEIVLNTTTPQTNVEKFLGAIAYLEKVYVPTSALSAYTTALSGYVDSSKIVGF